MLAAQTALGGGNVDAARDPGIARLLGHCGHPNGRPAGHRDCRCSFCPAPPPTPSGTARSNAFMFPRRRCSDRGVSGRTDQRTECRTGTSIGIRPTIPESSRLMYGLGAVIHLTQVVSAGPGAAVRGPDRGGVSHESARHGVRTHRSGRTPTKRAPTFGPGSRQSSASFAEFNGWEDWYETRRSGWCDSGSSPREAASVPLCQAVVVKVKGIDSVVIDTEHLVQRGHAQPIEGGRGPAQLAQRLPRLLLQHGVQGSSHRRLATGVGTGGIVNTRRWSCARC